MTSEISAVTNSFQRKVACFKIMYLALSFVTMRNHFRPVTQPLQRQTLHDKWAVLEFYASMR